MIVDAATSLILFPSNNEFTFISSDPGTGRYDDGIFSSSKMIIDSKINKNVTFILFVSDRIIADMTKC